MKLSIHIIYDYFDTTLWSRFPRGLTHTSLVLSAAAARCCRIRNRQRAAVRRCSSCSSLGQRTGLERSLSL
uniref:Uncharacterized protein n=1 Tax=Brassica oleracea TaxID=3712 RepID=A0A3P6CI81_BRAOL|nr:unnamed protein product [Brassica oleracea]